VRVVDRATGRRTGSSDMLYTGISSRTCGAKAHRVGGDLD
jgi:hypothetical protein